MGRSPTSSTMACRPRSTNSLWESMCCRTTPLSWMNSLVRFQSWFVVTAILSNPIMFSKIFNDIPVKVRLSRRGAPAHHLDHVTRLCPDSPHRRICGLDVGYLEGFNMVLFEDLFCLGSFKQNVLW